MSEWVPVTEDDLGRARREPTFRQELLAANLDRLIVALTRLQRLTQPSEAQSDQIREGVALALKLADRLHAIAASAPDKPNAA